MKLGRVGVYAGLTAVASLEQEKKVSSAATQRKTGIYNMTCDSGSTCKLQIAPVRASCVKESIF
jgi:hypothetical protein